MIIRSNKKFQKLVGKDFTIDKIRPCKYLSLGNDEEIIEIEGCYYFKKLAHNGKLGNNINKMEFEFDNNKIRVNDLLKDNIFGMGSFWCGLFMVKNLLNELQIKFEKDFEVILSYNYEDCFVSFYKIRVGTNNVMSNDLEGFKLEAILRVVI